MSDAITAILDVHDNPRTCNDSQSMLLALATEQPGQLGALMRLALARRSPSSAFLDMTLDLLPDEAVSANQDKRIVYVLGEGDKVSAKVVKLGPIVDGYRVIREGLKGDEQVVINGVAKIRPGAQVKPETTELPPTKK